MGTLGSTDYTADNLVTATKKLVTTDTLQLEAGVVVRGEVLKKGTTGLVKLTTAATDVPYCVSLQNIDASGSAQDIVYSHDGSFLESELTYGNGAIADYRDDFVTSTNLFVEE